MPADRVDLHIVSYVRWEREGALPFQQARLDYVRTLDGLLDLLERDPAHPGFLLGGQVIGVDDYLDIRPQAADRLARAVASGQIQIGPWYVLPDPLLASPESLIRNLLFGQQSADALAAPSPPALLIDASGVPSQFPQILRGFGLSSMVLNDRSGDLVPEMWWDGPDGSRLMVASLSHNAVGLPLEREELRAKLLDVAGTLGAESQTGVLLLLHPAGDPHDELALSEALEGLYRRSGGLRVVPGTLGAYTHAALESTAFYPLATGELCLSGQLDMHGGVLSSQMWIKQRNHALQTLLERWAEPFSTWIDALGSAGHAGSGSALLPDNPADLVHHAWRLLLKNHSVNAIHGAVADDIADELKSRFSQVEQLAGAIADLSLSTLAARVTPPEVGGSADGATVVVFNAGGRSATDLVYVAPPAPLKPGSTLEAVDEYGAVHPVELDVIMHETGEREQRLAFVAQDVPSTGYRAYTLHPAGTTAPSMIEEEGTTIENDHLHVTVNTENGTVTVFDRATGETFPGLNHYVDTGDCGDVYTYCPPPRDLFVDVPTNAPLHVQRIAGPVTQSLEVLQIYRLPAGLTPTRDARQPLAMQFVPITIATRYCLARGVPRLDVDVMISNDASDHRLRVLFPAGVRAQAAWFDGHFEVVQRPIGGAGVLSHQRAFTTVAEGDRGLTIANRGLPAVSVDVDKEGAATIAITLLRSVGWLSRDDLPNRSGHSGPPVAASAAQNHGSHTFSYSIIPHGGDLLAAWQAAWAFQTPLRAITPGQDRPARTLPPSGSLVAVDNPAFVLSAVKRSEDGRGVVVRGYNLGGDVEPVSLRFGLPFESVAFARLDETPLDAAPQVEGYEVRFDARPGEIVTLVFATP
jgi:mannosylglycerate hydrolase